MKVTTQGFGKMLTKITMTRKKTEGRKEGGLSCFSKSESAAATAMAAILLLALLFTMISVVKLEYVPEWKNDVEREYMYDMLDDMAGVKTNIDILSRLLKLNNSSYYNISVTVPVDMGGGEIPFLEPSKSDGKLEVNTERYAMTIVPRSPSQTIMPYTLEFKGITCYSENKQYPNQIFRYENGALILADDKGSAMRCPPSFIIKENKTNTSNCTVIIQAVQLTGKQDSVSSNTIIPLELTGYGIESAFNSDDYKNAGTIINAFNLTIDTRYPGAWIAYLNETAQDQGLDYGKDYIVQYLRGSGHVRFSFLPSGNKTLEGLYVNKTIVGVDIGSGDNFDYNYIPGSIENVMILKQRYFFDTFNGTYKGSSLSTDSTDPDVLTDRNKNYSLPVGSFNNQSLSSYTQVNDFNYSMDKGKTLDLNFGFNNFSSFSSNLTPKNATICMIYSFDGSIKPNIVMTLAGTGSDTFKPNDGWCLYNKTLSTSLSPTSPKDITLNLKVTTDNVNNAAGTFRIDYLAVYLS